MRLVVFLVSLFSAAFAFAADLAGTYNLAGPNGGVTVKFTVTGTTLGGVIEVGGKPFAELTGTAQGMTGRGTAVSKDGTGGFEASVEGDVLNLVLTQEAGPERRAGRLPIQLTRLGAIASPTLDAATGGDTRMIANWVSQNLVTSGDASMATEEYLAFRADGTFLYGRGRSTAGGSDWSWESGNGEAQSGQWRTSNGLLFARPSSGQWLRVGSYGMTDDGATMQITTDQGEKKLWSRRK